jgi:hypothetical protein
VARRRKNGPAPAARGGFREGSGRRTLFPGKYRGNSEVIGYKVSAVLSATGHEAAVRKQEDLSVTEGFNVSLSDAVEWCVRKATRTPMSA